MKKIIMVVIVIVLVFAFATTAFATYGTEAKWSSTICYNSFTTTESTYKPSGSWYQLWAYSINVEYVPTSLFDWGYATPVHYLSGASMGPRGYISNSQTWPIDNDNGVSRIKLKIENANKDHGGPNMISSGKFKGVY